MYIRLVSFLAISTTWNQLHLYYYFRYLSIYELWKISKEMGIPDHFIYLLRNLYADREAIVRTGHGTMEWFKIGKGVRQGCILSPWLFNLYAEYIMWNGGLSQARITVAGRDINNLRYADDTTLMAESEEKRASWWGWKEEIAKLAWNSTFKKLRSWHLIPSLHGK